MSLFQDSTSIANSATRASQVFFIIAPSGTGKTTYVDQYNAGGVTNAVAMVDGDLVLARLYDTKPQGWWKHTSDADDLEIAQALHEYATQIVPLHQRVAVLISVSPNVMQHMLHLYLHVIVVNPDRAVVERGLQRRTASGLQRGHPQIDDLEQVMAASDQCVSLAVRYALRWRQQVGQCVLRCLGHAVARVFSSYGLHFCVPLEPYLELTYYPPLDSSLMLVLPRDFISLANGQSPPLLASFHDYDYRPEIHQEYDEDVMPDYQNDEVPGPDELSVDQDDDWDDNSYDGDGHEYDQQHLEMFWEDQERRENQDGAPEPWDDDEDEESDHDEESTTVPYTMPKNAVEVWVSHADDPMDRRHTLIILPMVEVRGHEAAVAALPFCDVMSHHLVTRPGDFLDDDEVSLPPTDDDDKTYVEVWDLRDATDTVRREW